MIARTLEAAGLPTTSIGLVREHTEAVKQPRALFMPFPFGAAFGRPNDAELQHRVLRAALDLLAEPSGPVLRDFAAAAADAEPDAPVQASAVLVEPVPAVDAALETSRMRRNQEQWLRRTGMTAVGLTRIAPTRFRGLVRFLEAFAAGADVDARDRPADLPLPFFIRYCADDLKALYFEGWQEMTPGRGGAEFARWFWGETAAGQLLHRVKDRLDSSEDPRLKAAAFGIAR